LPIAPNLTADLSGRPYKDQFISGRAPYTKKMVWNAGEVGKRAPELFEKFMAWYQTDQE